MCYKLLLSRIILVLFIFFLGRAYYSSTNFACTKFIGLNLKDPQGWHIFNCCLIQIVGLFMTCVHTRFQMPRSIGSSVIAIKLKAKYKFHAAAMLSFHILQKKKDLSKSCIFFEDLLSYSLSFQDPILSGDSVASTSQVRASAMLLLSIVIN
jgi:hypothetical protein